GFYRAILLRASPDLRPVAGADADDHHRAAEPADDTAGDHSHPVSAMGSAARRNVPRPTARRRVSQLPVECRKILPQKPARVSTFFVRCPSFKTRNVTRASGPCVKPRKFASRALGILSTHLHGPEARVT